MPLNLFSFSGLLLLVTCLIVSLITAISRKSKLHKMWMFFNISIAVWGLGAYFVGRAQDPHSALLSMRFAHFGIILMPVLFFHFTCLFCNAEKPRTLRFFYILAGVFSLLNLTDYFLHSTQFFLNSFYYTRNDGFLYPIFFCFWMLIVLYALFELFKAYRRPSLSSIERNQVRYLIFGILIGFTGGVTNFLPHFGIQLYPFGNFTIPLYCIIVTYAILKFNLLDIKLAITRTGLFIVVYTLVLGLPFALAAYARSWLIQTFDLYWWMVPLISMAALATIGPFFYINLQHKAEARLLREQRRYQDTLKQASIVMTRIRNLHKLLSLITHIVTKTVKINYAAIYLFDKNNEEFVLQVFRDSGRTPQQTLPADSPVIKWLLLKQQPLIFEEIKRLTHDSRNPLISEIQEHMSRIMASVIVPSFLEQKLTGFIVLGDKLSKQIYTTDDLNVFQVLASQAALAIENAQFYEDAKEMQAQIAQAEKMATIGTMADGLSHQINNRFYALSLIAGDTIDTIKFTDTSKCTDDVKEMIKQISSALERIQTNVMQGGEVVNGILKYTRKGEQGLEPLTLDRILDSTLEMVKYKVKIHEIDIVRDYTADAPRIKGNLVQMQEVFFNFIDNAYDAIVERRNTLQEKDYRGKITVSAKLKGESVEIVLQDNGMGVKKDDLKKVFTPFFTTKVSSRKGTGLGLYVIRNIITVNHGGKLRFDSAYKVGTQFIIELPAALT